MKKNTMMCTFAVLALTIFSSPALAQISVGVGLKGGLNGSAVSEVPEDQGIDPDFHPMFGMGGTIGATVEARALGVIGLETGFHLSFDNGSGNEDINDGFGTRVLTVDQDQRTTAFHVPILVKLRIPFPMVSPVFGIGTEIVIQSDSELQYEVAEEPGVQSNFSELNARNAIDTSVYPLFMLTAGIEVKIGDVRIPLELRAGYNLGFENTFSSRVEVEGNLETGTYVYDGAYQGHFGLFTGIIYDFDLL